MAKTSSAWNWNQDKVKPVNTSKNVPYPGPKSNTINAIKISVPQTKKVKRSSPVKLKNGNKVPAKFSPVKFQKMQKKVFGLA